MTELQLEVLAQIYAANARVLGMVADNQQRQVQGESVAWTGDHFQAEAAHLEYLSQRVLQS